MRDLDDFLPLILPYAPNAPEPIVFRCLRDAAIRFCDRTELWRSSDTITTDGLNPEPISMPPDAILAKIVTCAIDGIALDPVSIVDLSRDRPDWRTEDVGTGGASWYVSPDFGTVQAVPRASGTITVDFIAKPTVDALTLPDFLFDHYGQVLADGAAGAVLLMPGSFSNPQLGAGLSARFENKIDGLFNAGRRGQHRAPTHTRGRYF